MMDKSEKEQWTLLTVVLRKILQGSIGLTEGCREVYRIRGEVGMENDLFMPFVGYESESDAFPMGEVRKLWSADGLARADREREKVEAHYKEWIFESAEALLEYAKRQ